MSVNDIKHLAVETIYLVPDASEGQRCYLWCDDPAPGLDMDPSESVEYLRKDVHDAIIAKQANAAKQGMDAAKKVAGSNLEQAKRLQAESSPAALESEREANARLTELVAKLEQERDAAIERLECELYSKCRNDGSVMADAYRKCADMITPWLGEENGTDTLVNSVSRSLEFLIQQWREKKTLEQERSALVAHVGRLAEARNNPRIDTLMSILEIIDDAPTASLARRDTLKQAEGWEQAAHVIEIMECPKSAQFFREGVVNHLRYKAEKMRRQAEAHQ